MRDGKVERGESKLRGNCREGNVERGTLRERQVQRGES
jgi:hypothetical protein